MLDYSDTPVVTLRHPHLQAGVTVLMKREELNHPRVSGNKWWKLKYNLEAARSQGKNRLVTFGGAYSNHLYATAAAAKELGLKSTGIVRGDEVKPLNSTIEFAQSCGMEIIYVSRADYRMRNSNVALWKKITEKYPDALILPEGGTNSFALEGLHEFGQKLLALNATHVCVPVGTGGTMAGLIMALQDRVHVRGYVALKGGQGFEQNIQELLEQNVNANLINWSLCTEGHHGGYAKVTPHLIKSMSEFERHNGFPLDPVYTGKMMHALWKEIEEQVFPPGSVVLAIHTGGLQGWHGIRQRYPEFF